MRERLYGNQGDSVAWIYHRSRRPCCVGRLLRTFILPPLGCLWWSKLVWTTECEHRRPIPLGILQAQGSWATLKSEAVRFMRKVSSRFPPPPTAQRLCRGSDPLGASLFGLARWGEQPGVVWRAPPQSRASEEDRWRLAWCCGPAAAARMRAMSIPPRAPVHVLRLLAAVNHWTHEGCSWPEEKSETVYRVSFLCLFSSFGVGTINTTSSSSWRVHACSVPVVGYL